MVIDNNKPLINLKDDGRYPEGKRPSVKTVKNHGGRKSGSEKPAAYQRSREVSHLENLIRSIPNIREALVERLRRDYHSGNYYVKAEKIAEKILGDNLADEISQAQLDPTHLKKIK
jgi:anti-sigma28 factor (negative regulator of flagellin synthesis)